MLPWQMLGFYSFLNYSLNITDNTTTNLFPLDKKTILMEQEPENKTDLNFSF